MGEAVGEKLLHLSAEVTEFSFEEIEALPFRWRQQVFDLLAVEGDAVEGTEFGCHVTPPGPETGAEVPAENGGEQRFACREMDEQVDYGEMVFPPGAAFSPAGGTDISSAHPVEQRLEIRLPRPDGRSALLNEAEASRRQ
jgi:hypothetical protein